MWTVYIFISNSYTLGFALSYCFSRTLFRKRIKCLFSEHFLASKSCLFPRCITRIVISNLGMSIGIFFRSMLLFTATSPELHPPIMLHGAKQSFIDRCPSASWASIHSWKSVCGREPPSITNKKKVENRTTEKRKSAFSLIPKNMELKYHITELIVCC